MFTKLKLKSVGFIRTDKETKSLMEFYNYMYWIKINMNKRIFQFKLNEMF